MGMPLSSSIFQYLASVIRLGSRDPGLKVWPTPGRSSGIRHRNKLTAKACEIAVQKLGKVCLSVCRHFLFLNFLYLPMKGFSTGKILASGLKKAKVIGMIFITVWVAKVLEGTV